MQRRALVARNMTNAAKHLEYVQLLKALNCRKCLIWLMHTKYAWIVVRKVGKESSGMNCTKGLESQIAFVECVAELLLQRTVLRSLESFFRRSTRGFFQRSTKKSFKVLEAVTEKDQQQDCDRRECAGRRVGRFWHSKKKIYQGFVYCSSGFSEILGLKELSGHQSMQRVKQVYLEVFTVSINEPPMYTMVPLSLCKHSVSF